MSLLGRGPLGPKLLGATLVASLAIGAGWFVHGLASALMADGYEVGETVPPLEFTTLDGQSISMEDLRGKVVLLDVFSIHCLGCVGATPRHNRLYERYRDEGLVVLGISVDETERGALERYVDERPMNYPVTLERDGRYSKALGVRSLPAELLLDADGVLRARHEGFTREETMAREIGFLLSSAPTVALNSE